MAARFDRDFVLSAGSREGGRAMLARLLRPVAAALLRHPLRALGGAVLLATVGAVSVNALAWQTKRHPSPLFAAKPGEPRRVAAAAPPARPPLAAVPPPATPARAPLTEAPRPRDPIGEAIRALETGSVSAQGRSEGPKSVAAAQRALARLGDATVKVDGVMGPGTRQAIERFERERKIPVTGELNARTVKELSARSGLPIE